MEWKDICLLLGVAVTLILGVGNLIFSLVNNRRTTFINSVTAERVRWINTLRENLSRFAGLVFNYATVAHTDDAESRTIFRKTDRLRLLIKLQLNPNEPFDQEIEALLDQIYLQNKGIGTEGTLKLLDDLIKAGQRLLKQEWDKVKEESSEATYKIHGVTESESFGVA
jgi:hypothetical protein